MSIPVDHFPGQPRDTLRGYHRQEDGSDWILSFRCQGPRGGMAPCLFPGMGGSGSAGAAVLNQGVKEHVVFHRAPRSARVSSGSPVVSPGLLSQDRR